MGGAACLKTLSWLPVSASNDDWHLMATNAGGWLDRAGWAGWAGNLKKQQRHNLINCCPGRPAFDIGRL